MIILFCLLALLIGPLLWEVWKHEIRPRLVGFTPKQLEAVQRFNADSKIDVPSFFDAAAAAADRLRLENLGILNPSGNIPKIIRPYPDVREWYYRQMLWTEPYTYHTFVKNNKNRQAQYDAECESYEDTYTLYNSSLHSAYGMYIELGDSRESAMHFFESQYPDKAQEIRDKVEAEYLKRQEERREWEEKKLKERKEAAKKKVRAAGKPPTRRDSYEIVSWESSSVSSRKAYLDDLDDFPMPW